MKEIKEFTENHRLMLKLIAENKYRNTKQVAFEQNLTEDEVWETRKLFPTFGIKMTLTDE